MSGQLMQEKHGHDELKSEIISAVPTPKHPPPSYDAESSFWWEGSSTHTISTCKFRNNLYYYAKFVENGVNFIKNESIFFHGIFASHSFEVFHR